MVILHCPIKVRALGTTAISGIQSACGTSIIFSSARMPSHGIAGSVNYSFCEGLFFWSLCEIYLKPYPHTPFSSALKAASFSALKTNASKWEPAWSAGERLLMFHN
jgi:hypothetical protein